MQVPQENQDLRDRKVSKVCKAFLVSTDSLVRRVKLESQEKEVCQDVEVYLVYVVSQELLESPDHLDHQVLQVETGYQEFLSIYHLFREFKVYQENKESQVLRAREVQKANEVIQDMKVPQVLKVIKEKEESLDFLVLMGKKEKKDSQEKLVVLELLEKEVFLAFRDLEVNLV